MIYVTSVCYIFLKERSICILNLFDRKEKKMLHYNVLEYETILNILQKLKLYLNL